MKTEVKMQVPPEVDAQMKRYGKRATKAVTAYLRGCKTNDERLGALSVLLNVGLGVGDAIQNIETAKAGTAVN